jgi:glycosyltransferase involved in cell wall biosynthesis
MGESFPLETPVGEVEARTEGPYIQVRARSADPWGKVGRALWSLEDVLPLDPRPASLPTVAVVMPYLAVGGAEQIALKVMQELKDELRFIVLTFEEMDPALGTTTEAFRLITPYVYNLRDFIDPALNLSFLDSLDIRFQLDSLYIHNGTPWIYDALSEIKKRRPNLRIVDQVYDNHVGWINRYDPSVALYLDGHIGVNSKICQAYIDKGARPESVFLIENGVDPGELDPAGYPQAEIEALKERLGLPAGRRVVTFASRVHPQKRPMDFVELARRLSSDPSMAFLMVGDGPLAEQVDAQAAKLGLKNFYRQRFYRPISDILALTDVLVLPSDFEGMPMIVIEAQTMGKPVVVTDVGNNRDILDRTGGGVVIPQIGDVGALMSGVQALLASPPDAERLRQTAIEHFSIQMVAKRYRDALVGNSRA